MGREKLLKIGKVILSFVLLLGLWSLLSLQLTDSVLPSPLLTLQTMYKDVMSGAVFPALGVTLLRVLKGFAMTMLFGIAIGCLLGLSNTAKDIFGNWVVIGTSIPPLVMIIVVFLGMGLSEDAALVATVLTTVFTIIQNIEQGVRNIDPKLDEMAKVMNAGKTYRLRRVILPQIYPYVMASARFGISLTWKMVIFVEQMGRSNGVGYSINHWYQMYNMSHVLSYALVFIIVMLCIEFVINHVIEPLLFRWQPKKKS